MRTRLYKSALVVVLATSLLAGTGAAQAWWCKNGYCHHTRYVNHPRYVHGCTVVPGHRGPHGGWVHSYRVCR